MLAAAAARDAMLPGPIYLLDMRAFLLHILA